jgi:hypothetical protein
MDVYIPQKQAADALCLSARTLERYRLEGFGPKFVKAGRRVLYRQSDLDAWLAANTFSSTSEAKEASR